MYLNVFVLVYELKNEFFFKIVVFVFFCISYICNNMFFYLFIFLKIWENNFFYGIIFLGICFIVFFVVLEY